MRLIHTLLVLSIITLFEPLAAQNSNRPVELTVTRNDDGEPTFYAFNNTNIPYTITVDITQYQNTLPPSPNPFVATVRPGRKRLFQLRKRGGGSGGIGYRYSSNYSIGCHDEQPDTDIPYLLPVKQGTTTKLLGIGYLGNMIGEETPENFNVAGFRAEGGDTVYATRKGVAGRITNKYESPIPEKYFTSQVNYIDIIHEDCTFGRYSMLKKDGFLISEGEKVYPGDPVAIVSPRKGGPAHVRFLLMTRNPDYDPENEDSSFWQYIQPRFHTSGKADGVLKPGDEVISIHPGQIIKKEMSRREKRRWRRNN